VSVPISFHMMVFTRKSHAPDEEGYDTTAPEVG
jgi:hypothetical protein